MSEKEEFKKIPEDPRDCDFTNYSVLSNMLIYKTLIVPPGFFKTVDNGDGSYTHTFEERK